MRSKRRILEVRGLEAGYGGPAIVRGVDLDIFEASMVTFVGPNGAGKSSLLRALYGTAKVYAGTISLAGNGRIDGLSAIQRFAIGLAFVPQGRCNFAQMSVAEKLATLI